MTLPPGEPAAGPWRVVRLEELLDLVLAAAGDTLGRPRVVAVDGRGASGTTTLAARLQGLVPASAVVHTDDIGWHQPLFGWGHLLAGHVLRPLHEGAPVDWATGINGDAVVLVGPRLTARRAGRRAVRASRRSRRPAR